MPYFKMKQIKDYDVSIDELLKLVEKKADEIQEKLNGLQRQVKGTPEMSELKAKMVILEKEVKKLKSDKAVMAEKIITQAKLIEELTKYDD
jgi:hypothetical protein